ncbi:MAG: alkaline phosphatase D family protein [Pseudomonadota bacterium]
MRFFKHVALAASVAALGAACTTIEPEVAQKSANATAEAAPMAEEPWAMAAKDRSGGPDGIIQATPMPSAPLDRSVRLDRIVFGSCVQQNEDQSMWDQLTAVKPQLSLFIGDNVYGDVRSRDQSLPELKAAYMRLGQSEPFARFRAAAPLLTTWDDHDFGLNDAGGDYAYKEQSEELFEYVWALPEDDARRAREGIYGSWMLGPKGEQVHLIMLDTRYFRSPLMETDDRGAKGKERYLPDPDPAKTMLGDAQWVWLEAELEKPADLTILVSSIQVIAEGHGWEAWRTLPTERQKLYDLLSRRNTDNLIVLSGDRHAGGLYQKDLSNGQTLTEITSSSINLPGARWREQSGETYVEPGPNRLGTMEYEANFGLIGIDWEQGLFSLSLRGEAGEEMQSVVVNFR